MNKQIRAAVMGFAAVIITGGVLLWATSPGMTIKRKYESYNGKVADGKHTLQEITLPVYDKIQIVTAQEACNLQDGILVLAYPACPFCRNLMPELLEAAKDTGTELYYCELDKYRNTYIYDRELNAPVQTKPAGEGYEELLTWLDGYTHDYIIKDPAGNEIPVGEQRISVPTLIRIQSGKPVSQWQLEYVQDVTYPDSGYDRWDEDVQKKVYNALCQYLEGEEPTEQ